MPVPCLTHLEVNELTFSPCREGEKESLEREGTIKPTGSCFLLSLSVFPH